MLHVGLDLSRRRVDVCLISSEGELVDHFPAPADRDGLYGLYGLTRRVAVYDEPVRGVIESMNGARFVHDELVAHGWGVLIADAQRLKGLAPLACKTDKIDSRVLAELSFRGSGGRTRCATAACNGSLRTSVRLAASTTAPSRSCGCWRASAPSGAWSGSGSSRRCCWMSSWPRVRARGRRVSIICWAWSGACWIGRSPSRVSPLRARRQRVTS